MDKGIAHTAVLQKCDKPTLILNNAYVLSNRNSPQVEILDFIKYQYPGS